MSNDFRRYLSKVILSFLFYFCVAANATIPCGKRWLETHGSTIYHVTAKQTTESADDSLDVGSPLQVVVSGDVFVRDTTCRYKNKQAYIFVEDTLWDVTVVEQSIVKLGQLIEHAAPSDSTRGIFDILTGAFGAFPDVDGDSRIFIYVVDLPGDNLVGYFDSRVSTHENPRFRHDAIYIDANFLNSRPRLAEATMAHELQHLIHWGHDPDEEIWLDEGLSGYAEALVGYPEADPNMVPKFLSNPDINFTSWPNSLSSATPYYGATYLFISFLREYFGAQFVFDLVSEPRNGIFAVDEVLKTQGTSLKFRDMWEEWIIANSVSLESEPRYAALKGRTAFAYGLDDMPISPIGGQVLQQWGVVNVLFRSSGSIRVNFDGADGIDYTLWSYGMRGSIGKAAKAELDGKNRSTIEWTTVDSLKLVVGSKSRIPGEFVISADYYMPDPVATNVHLSAGTPSSIWTLGNGFPNPFNSSISLPIQLLQSQNVKMLVLNANGQKVRLLHDGWLTSGSHQFSWDGKNESGIRLASGRYQVLLRMKNRDEVRGMLLLK